MSMKETMPFRYDDGGRYDAGFRGTTKDCVVRAIAIVTGKPYKEVYKEISKLSPQSVRRGVPKAVYQPYMKKLGLVWTPTMGIGTGCRVTLSLDSLPPGRHVVRVTKHLTSVVDGVILDTYDCSRKGTRCVYGYWTLT